MTLAESTRPGRVGLLEKLIAAIRPEFRVEVLVADPDDPVLGVKSCEISGCDRPIKQRGICNGHYLRWKRAGSPDLVTFRAAQVAAQMGRRELDMCTVPDCRYGVAGHGLCCRHRDKWSRAGYPDAVLWAAAAAPLVTGSRQECHLSFCTLWTERTVNPFCKGHMTRWRNVGFPKLEEFSAGCERYGKPCTDFRSLQPQVKLEIQYAVQCRHDERTATAPPRVLRWTVNNIAKSGVASLLDLTEDEWEQRLGPRRDRTRRGGMRARADSFLFYARDVVETLRDGTGWEVEYPRDVWRLSKLAGLKHSSGRPRPRSTLRFDQITQLWLKDLGKRWVRWRLTSNINVGTAFADLQALTKFSEFLTYADPDITGLADINRALLERYLAWLTDQPGGTSCRGARVGSLHLFFQAIRQHGWNDTLPTTAVFFPGDFPRRQQHVVTRYLAEYVMAQVEQPANLDRWPYPEGRLITLILIRSGLRISSAANLSFDCLLHDGQNAPYLRYYNTKMEREAAVPIDEELETEIRAQQQRVLERWTAQSPHLFPRMRMNADGQKPLSPDTYRTWMQRWLKNCDVRDEYGRLVHLTPHQWRHTFATRLINRDVPHEVIRVLLDHETAEMTSHYAKIADKTVRRRWEQATTVNIKGERITLAPDGPLAQAQWAKTRYSMATQTLPNGYCGLPLQRSCPHANACLTCPVFLTGPEFLPELSEQRRHTLTLIDVSKSKGQTRVVEMNQQVLDSLDRIIAEVQKDERKDTDDAG
jgi:integrase